MVSEGKEEPTKKKQRLDIFHEETSFATHVINHDRFSRHFPDNPFRETGNSIREKSPYL